jgi:hypothetical protein
MSDKTLLMIAYHFPPENVIGAARPFRFYKYAPMFGWTPVVVTAAPQDPNYTPAGVHYIADPFSTKPRSSEWHVERVIRRFAVPDLGLTWSRHVARFCRAQIDAVKPGKSVVVYSTFPPVGTHLAALQVVRKHRACWIADYRDPYAGHHTRSALSTRCSRFAARQIDRRMIETASIVIANTEAAAQELKSEYAHIADKITVIWNGYDPSEDLIAPSLPAGERKIILHSGTMYAGRHTGPVMTSISRLIENGRISPASILFRFVGTCVAGSLIPADIVQSGIRRGWIEVFAEVLPHAAAVEMAQQANALLLLQPQSRTQVPGKLFEYIRIGRPILAFIQKHSPIDDILSRCGIPNVCIYPEDDADSIDDALLRFLAIPSGPWKPSQWFESTFNAVEQARILCSLADQALKRYPFRAESV